MRGIKIKLLLIGILAVFLAVYLFNASQAHQYQPPPTNNNKNNLFLVQAVDTMKYSRDKARETLHDVSFEQVIDTQMRLIREMGATHVAIGTPYDPEFAPILTRWVNSARKNNLSVWFRGNFSGWEGWFEYEKIDRSDHKKLLASFLVKNHELFVDGDIFSPCPECENGGEGDPRATGDRAGFTKFLIEERSIAEREFNAMGKSIAIRPTMNADIAREILDPDTARLLGGVILIDHYVNSVKKFGEDVDSISKTLNARIGLGEFGAPIPDINGNMTEKSQAEFVRKLLDELYIRNEEIPLVNYWVLNDGSTALMNDSGTPRLAYHVLKTYFTAPRIYGTVFNSLGEPLDGVDIAVASTSYSTKTDAGLYNMFLLDPQRTVTVNHKGYKNLTVVFPADIASSTQKDFYLEPEHASPWYEIKKIYYQLFLR
ncbi:MAG: carboxypeptidase-like regulatory domain-containing protein [bacterium]|nr:carboxypeptidase-like regulatory domain-containing protein [bacterium]